MNDKQQLLLMLTDEFSRWETLLASYRVEQIVAPQPSNLSIKDEIAHLKAWQQRSNARMEAALHDTEPVYPVWPSEFDPEQPGEPHDLNAWIYKTHRDQPWASVHRDWREGFQKLIELSAAIPEQDLLQKGRYSWLEGEPLAVVPQSSCEHHSEHRTELLARMP